MGSNVLANALLPVRGQVRRVRFDEPDAGMAPGFARANFGSVIVGFVSPGPVATALLGFVRAPTRVSTRIVTAGCGAAGRSGWTGMDMAEVTRYGGCSDRSMDLPLFLL